MSLAFTNILKGVITETLLKVLFERGGYRVTRLGIEELFAEVKHLEKQQYLGLGLPTQLRHLPDLLVAQLDMGRAFMVEVKFRRRFDQRAAESLYRELNDQREYWPEAHAVIMISDSFVPNGRFHQDYIRVLKPGEQKNLIDTEKSPDQRWDDLHQLQRVFTNFNKDQYASDVQKSADTLTQTLLHLGQPEMLE